MNKSNTSSSEPVTRKVITLKETGAVRPPKHGEWFRNEHRGFSQAGCDYKLEHEILTMSESYESITVPDGARELYFALHNLELKIKAISINDLYLACKEVEFGFWNEPITKWTPYDHRDVILKICTICHEAMAGTNPQTDSPRSDVGRVNDSKKAVHIKDGILILQDEGSLPQPWDNDPKLTPSPVQDSKKEASLPLSRSDLDKFKGEITGFHWEGDVEDLVAQARTAIELQEALEWFESNLCECTRFGWGTVLLRDYKKTDTGIVINGLRVEASTLFVAIQNAMGKESKKGPI